MLLDQGTRLGQMVRLQTVVGEQLDVRIDPELCFSIGMLYMHVGEGSSREKK